jgi:heat shock protein HtpX
MRNIYEQVSSNQQKSWLVIGGFIAFITAAVYILVLGFDLDLSFVGLALIFSGVSGIGSYYYSDRLVLAMTHAKPADPNEHRKFHQVAENLAGVARIPKPKLYVIQDQSLNAFATGRNPKHAAVAATTGLLESLNRTQLEGVVAHELAHVKNYDTLLMSVVAILAGSLAILVNWMSRMMIFGGGRRDDRGKAGGIMMLLGLVVLILAPIVATIIKLAISRRREFLADAWAAKLTRYPQGLIEALEILHSQNRPLRHASPATAHMFITNPLGRQQVGNYINNLFSTHPPVEARIAALRGE